MTDFDFSQFHPLDHWPGTRRCREHYGGIRNHLQLTWEFRRKDQLLKPVYKLILCPIGHHKVQVWYTTTDDKGTTIHPKCMYCSYTRPPSEYDIDKIKYFPPFLRGEE